MAYGLKAPSCDPGSQKLVTHARVNMLNELEIIVVLRVRQRYGINRFDLIFYTEINVNSQIYLAYW